LGVAFLGAAFFLVAAALVAGAEGAVLLVTRPDLVFPRITGAFSSTAGAWSHVSTRCNILDAMDTYRSALSDLGDVSLGLGCGLSGGSLLGGSGLGCSLGSGGLLGGSSLLSRGLLCSSLVDISIRIPGCTTTPTHGLLGLRSSSLWCSLGGLGLGLLGLSLLGGRRRASLALCNLHGSGSTCCRLESRRTSVDVVSSPRKDR
jgi:hypothetical protein